MLIVCVRCANSGLNSSRSEQGQEFVLLARSFRLHHQLHLYLLDLLSYRLVLDACRHTRHTDKYELRERCICWVSSSGPLTQRLDGMLTNLLQIRDNKYGMVLYTWTEKLQRSTSVD